MIIINDGNGRSPIYRWFSHYSLHAWGDFQLPCDDRRMVESTSTWVNIISTNPHDVCTFCVSLNRSWVIWMLTAPQEMEKRLQSWEPWCSKTNFCCHFPGIFFDINWFPPCPLSWEHFMTPRRAEVECQSEEFDTLSLDDSGQESMVMPPCCILMIFDASDGPSLETASHLRQAQN